MMFVSSAWLLLAYLSPVLSMVPVMLIWQCLGPRLAMWQK